MKPTIINIIFAIILYAGEVIKTIIKTTFGLCFKTL